MLQALACVLLAACTIHDAAGSPVRGSHRSDDQTLLQLQEEQSSKTITQELKEDGKFGANSLATETLVSSGANSWLDSEKRSLTRDVEMRGDVGIERSYSDSGNVAEVPLKTKIHRETVPTGRIIQDDGDTVRISLSEQEDMSTAAAVEEPVGNSKMSGTAGGRSVTRASQMSGSFNGEGSADGQFGSREGGTARGGTSGSGGSQSGISGGGNHPPPSPLPPQRSPSGNAGWNYLPVYMMPAGSHTPTASTIGGGQTVMWMIPSEVANRGGGGNFFTTNAGVGRGGNVHPGTTPMYILLVPYGSGSVGSAGGGGMRWGGGGSAAGGSTTVRMIPVQYGGRGGTQWGGGSSTTGGGATVRVIPVQYGGGTGYGYMVPAGAAMPRPPQGSGSRAGTTYMAIPVAVVTSRGPPGGTRQGWSYRVVPVNYGGSTAPRSGGETTGSRSSASGGEVYYAVVTGRSGMPEHHGGAAQARHGGSAAG